MDERKQELLAVLNEKYTILEKKFRTYTYAKTSIEKKITYLKWVREQGIDIEIERLAGKRNWIAKERETMKVDRKELRTLIGLAKKV